MEEENKDIFIPQPMSDELFDEKITPQQRKFILLLVHSEGLKTATQCEVEAGYANRSALMVASRLQNDDKYPHVVKAIDSEVIKKSPNAQSFFEKVEVDGRMITAVDEDIIQPEISFDISERGTASMGDMVADLKDGTLKLVDNEDSNLTLKDLIVQIK